MNGFMDATVITLVGVLVGIASTLGIFKVLGKNVGQSLHNDANKAIQTFITDPEIKQNLISWMLFAKTYLQSKDGQTKMNFVLSKMLPLIPKAEQGAFHDFAQSVYDGYLSVPELPLAASPAPNLTPAVINGIVQSVQALNS